MKYFNNIEVKVIAEIGNNESVIEFISGLNVYQDEFEEYYEPIEQRIVVNNNQLTDKIIIKDDILQERDRIINDANNKAREIIQKANQDIRGELAKLQLEVKEMQKNRDKVNLENRYYQTALKLKEGIYKYVVYHFDILKFEDFKIKVKLNCTDEDSPKYENLTFRILDNSISYKSNSYWDSQFVLLCETEEEAIAKLYDKFLSLEKIQSIELVEKYHKYKFNIPKLEDSIRDTIEKHNKTMKEYIESYKKSMENYENRIYTL